MIGKKRLALLAGSATTVAAVATLVAGTTFGLFSSTQAGSANTFATGTVTVGNPVSTVCAVTNMVPGDDSAGYTPQLTGITDGTFAACKFSVKYSGSAPAYIGLSTAQSGNLPLLWQVAQSATDVSQPGAFANGSGVINSNSAASPLYVATDAGGDNTVYTFWVDYALPSTYTTQVNTGASLTLTVEAVQSGNNGDGTCTVGAQCIAPHINSWS
jgi:hypothetical protein